MRRVLLATPSDDRKTDIGYNFAAATTVELGRALGVAVIHLVIPGDAMVFRARNDFVKMALEAGVDDLFFIDADQEWEPAQFFRLLNHTVDIVAAPVRKKRDDRIDTNVGLWPGKPLEFNADGLLKVRQVGTGFMRISRKALITAWNNAKEYKDQGSTNRDVFFPAIDADGELLSEDVAFCRRWPGDLWVDPSFTVGHWGNKKYTCDFMEILRHVHPETFVPKPLPDAAVA